MGGQVQHAQRVRGVVHQRQQLVDPRLHVALAHPQLDLLVEQGEHRHRVLHPAVDPAQRDRAAAAHGVDRGVERAEPVHPGRLHGLAAQGGRQQPDRLVRRPGHGRAVRLHADRVHHGVRAAPVREVLELLRHVAAAVQRLDPVPLGHGPALGDRVHREHAVAQVPADPGGHLADGAQAQHGQRAALGRSRVLHGLPRGGHHVGEVQPALVLTGVRHLDGAVVGVRDAQVLGLPARHGAVEPRVAQERRAAAVLADLGGLALRLQALAAHVAVPAGDVERDDHAVPGLDVGDGRADLLHDAHGLVADDVALVHERAQHLVQVQVGPADPARGDPHDRVRGLLDPRIRDLLDAHRALSLPCQSLHRSSFPGPPDDHERQPADLFGPPILRAGLLAGTVRVPTAAANYAPKHVGPARTTLKPLGSISRGTAIFSGWISHGCAWSVPPVTSAKVGLDVLAQGQTSW